MAPAVSPPPIPTPAGAGAGIETGAVFGTPTTPVKPQTQEIVGKIPVGPEKAAEKIPMGAMGGDPSTILGIIEELPIPPAKPQEVLEAVANAEPKAPEPDKPADTAATPGNKPDAHADTAADTTADTAAIETKRQEIKSALRELGQILLDMRDVRASLVALSLSAGDTPMGDEFRDCVFRTIMSDTSLTAIPDDKRTEFVRKMDKHKPLSKEENPLRAFFIKAGYPEDYLDKFDFTGGIAHMIHEKNTWGAASKNAFALKEAFGWTKDHPMPTSAPELTKLLIDTPNENQVANMKSALTQEAVNRMIENARVSWQILKSPETMEKVMMGVMVFQMLLQMMQSESAAGQAGSH